MEEESAKTCAAANAIETEDSSKKVEVDTDPPFIRKMLAPISKLNCVFVVGDPILGPPENIGVSKDLLMAHSEPFRVMLEESALAEKGPVNVTDIQPQTFRNFLRFVYGYNNLSTLTMEEAVELIYVAEKYMVEELKPKLSAHICSILTVENVCIPLQRPECFQQESLKNAITEIIQDFTDILLCQQRFLDLNTFGLLNILQQDTLAVPEIELWKAVLRWANHNMQTKKTMFGADLHFGYMLLQNKKTAIGGAKIGSPTMKTHFNLAVGANILRMNGGSVSTSTSLDEPSVLMASAVTLVFVLSSSI